MKATTLLEQQLRNLLQLCELLERASASVRESLLPQLAGDLAAHLAVEERVFYPVACAALDDYEWMRLGGSWNDQARQTLDRALDAKIDGDDFVRAIGELRSAVEQHSQKDADLFPRLERVLPPSAMRALGASMMALYHAKLDAGYAAEDHYRADLVRWQNP